MDTATTLTSSSSSSNVGSSASSSDLLPNQTLYINNINEKVKKSQLKKSLYAAFSPYGSIADIVATKTLKLRGQAWVVFSDIAAASKALRELQGFIFYDKPLHIAYAKDKSQVIEKLEGTYRPRPKRRRDDDEKEEDHTNNEPNKRRNKNVSKPDPSISVSNTVVQPSSSVSVLPTLVIPNKMLLVQGLPNDMTEEVLKKVLQSLFGQFNGLVDIRSIPIRGLAFVEFNNEASAIPALQALHNFKLSSTHTLQITYAK